MKSIICYISSLASGGAEHQMLILATLLHEKGYDVTLVTCFDYPDHYLPPANLRVVRLNVTGSRFKKQMQITRYLIKQKVDCIISFREQMNFMVLIPMLFRPKIKVIVGERNLTVGKNTFYGWADLKFLYRRADYIVTNNHAQEEFIRSYTSRYNKKLRTIINYTEVDKYQYSYHEEGVKLKIGVFCRYAKQKNYARFAKAIQIVNSEFANKLEIHWYGKIHYENGVEREDYKKFSRFIEEEELKDVIFLHDAVVNVPEIMGDMDAVCQPSIYEGFSNSLSEGICCGKVVLAGDVSDNKYMVHDNKNGFLFNPYDEEDMAKTILKFIQLNSSERHQMCVESRCIAEQLFDKNKFLDSYISLIEN